MELGWRGLGAPKVPHAELGLVRVSQTKRRKRRKRARMSCHRTSRWRLAASHLLWAPRPWSLQPSWHGRTHAASSCRRCPPAKPPLPHPPAPAAPPCQGPSQLLWLQCPPSILSQGRMGAFQTGKARGSPPPVGPAQSQGWAELQLQTLTQKTCLKEPAAVPRCPLGQPAWPLGLEGCSLSLPRPALPPPQGAGRQAPFPAELLTYSARWLCTSLSWAQP